MDLQEELKALKERIAELEKLAKEEQEFPQEDDFYWYVDPTGRALIGEWEGFNIAKDMLEIGNIFKTEEQAEFAAEKLKVEAILRSYSRPFDEFVNNYFIEFCSYDDSLAINADADFRPQGTFYFDSEKTALQAIDEAGEWQIKRFIFGMEG